MMNCKTNLVKTSLSYSRLPKTLSEIVSSKTMVDNYETEFNYVTTYESKSELWDLVIPFVGSKNLKEVLGHAFNPTEFKELIVIKHWKDTDKTTVTNYEYRMSDRFYDRKKSKVLCIKPDAIYYYIGKSIRRVSEKSFNNIGYWFTKQLNDELGLKQHDWKFDNDLGKYCNIGQFINSYGLDKTFNSLEEAICKYLEIPSIRIFEDNYENTYRLSLLQSCRKLFRLHDYRKILDVLNNDDKYTKCWSIQSFITIYYKESAQYYHSHYYKLRLPDKIDDFKEECKRIQIKEIRKFNKARFKRRYTTKGYKRLLNKLFKKDSSFNFKVLSKQEAFNYCQNIGIHFLDQPTFYILINDTHLFSLSQSDLEICKNHINFDIYFQILEKMNILRRVYPIYETIDKIKRDFPNTTIPEYFNNINNNLPF